MILETTLQEKETIKTVNDYLGKPYTIWQRLTMGGIGSKRMMIEKASTHFDSYLAMTEDLNYANIELRPKGILVHFNKRLRQFAWLALYRDLQIDDQLDLTLEAKGCFLQFEGNLYLDMNHAFIKRLIIVKKKLEEN